MKSPIFCSLGPTISEDPSKLSQHSRWQWRRHLFHTTQNLFSTFMISPIFYWLHSLYMAFGVVCARTDFPNALTTTNSSTARVISHSLITEARSMSLTLGDLPCIDSCPGNTSHWLPIFTSRQLIDWNVVRPLSIITNYHPLTAANFQQSLSERQQSHPILASKSQNMTCLKASFLWNVWIHVCACMRVCILVPKWKNEQKLCTKKGKRATW